MIDYFIVGFISVFTCYIIVNFIISPVQKIGLNKMKTYILAFIIGLVVHLITEICGFSEMYKSKRYLTAIKMLSS